MSKRREARLHQIESTECPATAKEARSLCLMYASPRPQTVAAFCIECGVLLSRPPKAGEKLHRGICELCFQAKVSELLTLRYGKGGPVC